MKSTWRLWWCWDRFAANNSGYQGALPLRAACTVRQQNYTISRPGQACGIFNKQSKETPWSICSSQLGSQEQPALPRNSFTELVAEGRELGEVGRKSVPKVINPGLVVGHPYIQPPNLWWFCLWKMKSPNLYHLMSLSVIKSKERSIILTATRLGTDFLL